MRRRGIGATRAFISASSGDDDEVDRSRSFVRSSAAHPNIAPHVHASNHPLGSLCASLRRCERARSIVVRTPAPGSPARANPMKINNCAMREFEKGGYRRE